MRDRGACVDGERQRTRNSGFGGGELRRINRNAARGRGDVQHEGVAFHRNGLIPPGIIDRKLRRVSAFQGHGAVVILAIPGQARGEVCRASTPGPLNRIAACQIHAPRIDRIAVPKEKGDIDAIPAVGSAREETRFLYLDRALRRFDECGFRRLASNEHCDDDGDPACWIASFSCDTSKLRLLVGRAALRQ